MNLDACAVRRIRGPRDSRLRPDGLDRLPWPDAKRGRGRPRRPAVCCPVWRHRQCNRPHLRSRRCLRSVGDFCIDRQASGNRSSDVASRFPRGVQGRVRLPQPSVRREGQRQRSRRTGLRFRCRVGEIAVGGRPTIENDCDPRREDLRGSRSSRQPQGPDGRPLAQSHRADRLHSVRGVVRL